MTKISYARAEPPLSGLGDDAPMPNLRLLIWEAPHVPHLTGSERGPSWASALRRCQAQPPHAGTRLGSTASCGNRGRIMRP